jgi:hypothetical protein
MMGQADLTLRLENKYGRGNVSYMYTLYCLIDGNCPRKGGK